MSGAVRVRWAWLFLDLPDDGFEDALRFWAAVSSWTVSPRRGEQDQLATLLPGRRPGVDPGALSRP